LADQFARRHRFPLRSGPLFDQSASDRLKSLHVREQGPGRPD
jgi:hypothetical protein